MKINNNSLSNAIEYWIKKDNLYSVFFRRAANELILTDRIITYYNIPNHIVTDYINGLALKAENLFNKEHTNDENRIEILIKPMLEYTERFYESKIAKKVLKTLLPQDAVLKLDNMNIPLSAKNISKYIKRTKNYRAFIEMDEHELIREYYEDRKRIFNNNSIVIDEDKNSYTDMIDLQNSIADYVDNCDFDYSSVMSKDDYTWFINALIKYFNNEPFPEREKPIIIKGRQNKKHFGWYMNILYREQKGGKIDKEFIKFFMENISIYHTKPKTGERYKFSTIYRYFTQNPMTIY